MDWKIVSDTGCDLRTIEGLGSDIDYSYVPMKILVGDKEFVDTQELDVDNMLDVMYNYEGATSSSCPSPEDWYEAFKDADNIFALTISGSLSGSYNSALTAKNMILEDYPDKKICLLDSRLASSGMVLIVNELSRLIEEYHDFDKVSKEILKYMNNTSLVFYLNSFDNFIKNGRVNKVIGKLASILSIKLLCGPTAEGSIEICSKFRGAGKANDIILQEMQKKGYNGKEVYITHAQNPSGAASIEAAIKKIFPTAKITILPMTGLCSYYAERLGLIIGFEI